MVVVVTAEVEEETAAAAEALRLVPSDVCYMPIALSSVCYKVYMFLKHKRMVPPLNYKSLTSFELRYEFLNLN